MFDGVGALLRVGRQAAVDGRHEAVAVLVPAVAGQPPLQGRSGRIFPRDGVMDHGRQVVHVARLRPGIADVRRGQEHRVAGVEHQHRVGADGAMRHLHRVLQFERLQDLAENAPAPDFVDEFVVELDDFAHGPAVGLLLLGYGSAGHHGVEPRPDTQEAVRNVSRRGICILTNNARFAASVVLLSQPCAAVTTSLQTAVRTHTSRKRILK